VRPFKSVNDHGIWFWRGAQLWRKYVDVCEKYFGGALFSGLFAKGMMAVWVPQARPRRRR